jgi:hypothetical protein
LFIGVVATPKAAGVEIKWLFMNGVVVASSDNAPEQGEAGRTSYNNRMVQGLKPHYRRNLQRHHAKQLAKIPPF